MSDFFLQVRCRVHAPSLFHSAYRLTIGPPRTEVIVPLPSCLTGQLIQHRTSFKKYEYTRSTNKVSMSSPLIRYHRLEELFQRSYPRIHISPRTLLLTYWSVWHGICIDKITGIDLGDGGTLLIDALWILYSWTGGTC